MKYSLLIGLLVVVIFVVNCHSEKKRSGKDLAKTYCGSCHLFPEPGLLDKKTWEANILPVMGSKLGIEFYDGQYAVALSHNKVKAQQQASISFIDWMKLVDYYRAEAPAEMPPQNRQKIKEYSKSFLVKTPKARDNYPSATLVKIDPGNQVIYVANSSDSSLSIFDKDLSRVSKIKIGKIAVHMDFNENLTVPGNRSGMLTNIGNFYPGNQSAGTVDSFYIRADRIIKLGAVMIDSLPRPVQTTAIKNSYGYTDYLICGFGHETGALYYLSKKNTHSGYEKSLLNQQPGAISAYIDDYNNDGLPDFMVLFAQADESIYLFINKGNGNFESKQILRFPPVYGSTSFEMQDVNGDGLKDIIYTCGDNYDLSRVLKNYHGVYLYINRGNNNYVQTYFFPLNGCYKAIGRDFDKDGDIDIAAISFFPDINQPQESFVYLENNGRLQFSPYTIPTFNKGRWITIDAADIDSDGDEDIVIGNMPLKNSFTDTSNQETGAPFLFLLNTTKR